MNHGSSSAVAKLQSNAAELLKSDLLNGANTAALFNALNANSALRDDLLNKSNLSNRDLLNNFAMFNPNLASLSMLFQNQLDNGIN